MKKHFTFILLFSFFLNFSQSVEPLKIGIVGLSHSHVHWILGGNFEEIEIVGIVEKDQNLAQRILKQYNMDMNLVFKSMDEMIKKTKPEAVTAFGSIYKHLEVVEKCAPLGIHIMVEKPLAVSNEHALKMKTLANKYGVFLLTNYETTWYPSNHKAYKMIKDDVIGNPFKIIVRDGHQGPKEIGVNQEFLDWLIDPILNGGGAIMDFGCYGANLITWLMDGERPNSVTAFTQQIKPEIYPLVDDDATIILEYAKTQGIIQASWNWPYGRKDMEVYGKTGSIFAENANSIKIRMQNDTKEKTIKLESHSKPFNNPFSYFAAVIRGKETLVSTDLSSLENNLIVVEILQAARESAKTGKTIYLK